ncbi:MAG: hypothetical protein KGZ35_01145 [Truepera sp.]|nr:hypothetical protein [Truepera sp.]
MQYVLRYTLFFAGILLLVAYPLALLPIWAGVVIAVLVYLAGLYTDYSTTKWAVSRFGVEVEGDDIARFAIRRLGMPLGVLATSASSISISTLAIFFLLEKGFPHSLLAAFLVLGPAHLGAGLGNWLVNSAYRAWEKAKEQA